MRKLGLLSQPPQGCVSSTRVGISPWYGRYGAQGIAVPPVFSAV